ncbi:hypothetical protein OOJ09_13590 [Mesorhizobium qingshengii]|uniref:Uncharacterized protein n=1 Tax=Mesorhizobium qingshengii TaxID=1165689 RepID=A0ABT4QUF9_9HYPH|nr:hypothetical protein [Mesorhizobium qingshengii]MCZ8545219.1 hypothetical protein [Mesorhizobium qingshengii]
MTDEIRTGHIYQRAHALAEGGAHNSPAEIVATLLDEGYPEAAELLNTRNIHADLRRVVMPPPTDSLPLRTGTFATDPAVDGLCGWNGGR